MATKKVLFATVSFQIRKGRLPVLKSKRSSNRQPEQNDRKRSTESGTLNKKKFRYFLVLTICQLLLLCECVAHLQQSKTMSVHKMLFHVICCWPWPVLWVEVFLKLFAVLKLAWDRKNTTPMWASFSIVKLILLNVSVGFVTFWNFLFLVCYANFLIWNGPCVR